MDGGATLLALDSQGARFAAVNADGDIISINRDPNTSDTDGLRLFANALLVVGDAL
jgi:hypothetical protein